MRLQVADFNDAGPHFTGAGRAAWEAVQTVLSEAPLFLHPSDQAGKKGTLIFDPKGTNAYLTEAATARGWPPRKLPDELGEFGVDVDAGSGTHIVEWQFSNYPFLWNNLVRTECLARGGYTLPGMGRIAGLIVVTKVGALPASNSTLYFEQARNQIAVVARHGIIALPLRLVGLDIETGDRVRAFVSGYGGRYHRRTTSRRSAVVRVERTGGKYRFSGRG